MSVGCRIKQFMVVRRILSNKWILYVTGDGIQTTIPHSTTVEHWESTLEKEDSKKVWVDYGHYEGTDYYTLEDMTAAPSTITQVTYNCWYWASDATLTFAWLKMYTHSTEYIIDAWNMYQSNLKLHTKVMPTNPDTGLAWTIDEINDLQLGIRMNQSYPLGAGYVDQVYLEVEGY